MNGKEMDDIETTMVNTEMNYINIQRTDSDYISKFL
jgi:hypothetical protein